MKDVIDKLLTSENTLYIIFSWLPEPILNIIISAIIIIFIWLVIHIIIKIIDTFT